MKWVAPALCGLMASLGCARQQPPDGVTLLGRGHRAESTLTYSAREINEQVLTGAWPLAAGAREGTHVVMYGRPITTLVERTQRGPRKRRYEVITTNAPGARGAGMIIAQNGTNGWRYVPGSHRLDVLTFPSTDVGPLNWLFLVLSNYDVRDIRHDSVVQTPAWRLSLQPRQPDRPTKRMWLDADTWLPLRQELWGHDGRLLSVTQVVERPRRITPSPGPLAPPDVRQTGGVRVVQGDQEWLLSRDDLRARLGHPLARLAYMPEGFMEVGSYLFLGAGAAGPGVRWELTDGVATVNVIQTRTRLGNLDSLETPQDIQGAIETVQRGPFLFLVRGNIASAELRRIANGIALD